MTTCCGCLLRRCAWLVGFLAVVSVAHARPFDSWSIEHGLPQNSVNDILQTRDGYLWLATFGGLVRFDGVRFVVYDRSVAGVGSLRIRALRVDREGTLWAATEDGMLIRHRDGAFKTFTAADGLPRAGALRIDEDARGHLWITWQDVITRYDGYHFVNFRPGDFARGVRSHTGPRFPAGPHVVWWSQDADGVHCLRAGQVRTCLSPDQVPESGVAGVTDWHGATWIHTRGAGVVQVTDSAIRRHITTPAGLADHNVDGAWFEDRSGALWHVDSRGGLMRIKGGRSESIAGIQPLAFHEDREGSLWIGSTGGLHRLRVMTISTLTTRQGLSSDNVYSILRDRRGDIWIGTLDAGLNRYAGGRFLHYRASDGLPSNYVTSLYEDRAGTLWVGTRHGLAYLERGRFRLLDAAGGALSGSVMAMHEDRAGTLWLGTDGGLVGRQNGRLTSYTEADGLAPGGVISLHEDRSGSLWIGTTRGVTRFKDGTLTTYGERDGLIGNYVRAFHEDADGVMWIGTYDGGLYRMKEGRLTRYTTRDGLHDNGVFQILEDEEGNFWMSSNRGISRVSRRELNRRAAGAPEVVHATVFGTHDGLATLECNGGNQPAGMKMEDGTLWFPTQGGVAVVDTRAVRTNDRRPTVLIEALDLQGDAMNFRAGVTAAPGRNSFEVRYTALSFIKPEQIRFRHRLAGLDEKWTDAGDRRTAAYYRIPPGRYEFQVMAANSDGIWSRESDRATIVVLAPIWQRPWFLSTIGLALLAAIAAAERRRTLRQRREHARQQAYARQLLETQESERRRISNDLHDSLGQNLLLIRAQARMAGDGHDGHGDRAGLISSLAAKAYEEMKEIAYDLRPYHLDKIGVSRTIEGMLRRTSGASGIAFEADIDNIDDAVPANAAIHVYRIVQESVTNIVRHSAATHARVSVRCDAAGVEIEIADNGRGIRPGPGSANGDAVAGFGLMGIKERARSLNGDVTIRSAPTCGTTVRVTLPPVERGHA